MMSCMSSCMNNYIINVVIRVIFYSVTHTYHTCHHTHTYHTHVHVMHPTSSRIVGKPERGSAMYFLLILAILWGQYKFGWLRVTRGVGVNPTPRQIEHCILHVIEQDTIFFIIKSNSIILLTFNYTELTLRDKSWDRCLLVHRCPT